MVPEVISPAMVSTDVSIASMSTRKFSTYGEFGQARVRPVGEPDPLQKLWDALPTLIGLKPNA